MLTAIKQKHHIRGCAIMIFVAIIASIAAGLSPTDTTKIFWEIFLTIGEAVLCMMVIYHASSAVSLYHKDRTRSVLHTQGASSTSLIGGLRLATVCMILSLIMIAGVVGVIISVRMGRGVDANMLIILVYMCIKIILIYTIAYFLSFLLRGVLVIVCSLVIYVWLHMIDAVLAILQHTHQSMMYVTVKTVSFVVPKFVTIGLNPIQQEWLADNIFYIVIQYGIYISLLLVCAITIYTHRKRK